MKFVQECWSSHQVEGKHYYVIKEKFKMLKEGLRRWNREVFGIKDLHIDNIVKELNEVERIAVEGGSPKVEHKKALSAEFWQELHMKESILAQKARAKWIAEGDSNTWFFHACIRGNRRRTQLLKVRVDDQWIDDVQGVKVAVKNHFELGFREEVFKRPTLEGVCFKQVSLEENKMLVAPFTVDEIKEVVWECDGNKSLGPDGFNFNFIKNCWNIISQEILNFFKEFHSLARLPKLLSWLSFLKTIVHRG